jgi:hypothetical protein
VELGPSRQPLAPAAREVIEHDNVLAGADQALDEMASDETRAAGDEDTPHETQPATGRAFRQVQRTSLA